MVLHGNSMCLGGYALEGLEDEMTVHLKEPTRIAVSLGLKSTHKPLHHWRRSHQQANSTTDKVGHAAGIW
jgi:hypothetical protein